MTLAAAARALRDAPAIIITTHVNPDGDGIGAGLALAHGLRRLGKKVRFCCPSVPARIYSFLPGFAGIAPVVDEAAAKRVALAPLVLSCDAGDLRRLGAVAGLVERVRARGGRLLNLDHHASNDRFGDLNLVEVDAASSGVVAWRLLRRLGVALDRPLAECLYTTLVFDTGRFMHSNTSAAVFRLAADLLQTGIDAAAINRRLTYTRSLLDLRLTRLGIEHLAVDREEPRLAGIVLPRDAIDAVGGEPEDWGELVEIPRSLAGNQVAYLMRETPKRDAVRVSLRSNPPYRVGPVAEALGGGGHHQAAGCTVEGSLAEVRREVLARLRRACREVSREPAPR